jgi:hypothetical protein
MIISSKVFTGILIGATCFASVALADLVPVPTGFEEPINGTGFGNVSTLITLQTANGKSTTEAGCIEFGSSTADCGIARDGKMRIRPRLNRFPHLAHYAYFDNAGRWEIWICL